MNLKRFWQILRLLLGVVLLALALRQMDWQAVGSALAQVNPFWLLLALLSFLVTQLIKIMRWGWLAGVPLRPWLTRLSAAFFIGQAANILLPVRGGEVVRLGWLSASAKADPGLAVSAGAALVLEKFLDMLALLALLALLLPVLPAELLSRTQNWLLPVGIAASILILGSLWFGPLLWRMIRPVLESRFGWNTARVDSWLERLSALRSARVLLPSAAATLLIWLIMWLTNLLVSARTEPARHPSRRGPLPGLDLRRAHPGGHAGQLRPLLLFRHARPGPLRHQHRRAGRLRHPSPRPGDPAAPDDIRHTAARPTPGKASVAS